MKEWGGSVVASEAVRPGTEHPDIRVVREPRLVERLLILGGLPACGKAMMAPILGSLARVGIQKFDEPLEHLCGLRLLGKLDEETATVMIRSLDLDVPDERAQ